MLESRECSLNKIHTITGRFPFNCSCCSTSPLLATGVISADNRCPRHNHLLLLHLAILDLLSLPSSSASKSARPLTILGWQKLSRGGGGNSNERNDQLECFNRCHRILTWMSFTLNGPATYSWPCHLLDRLNDLMVWLRVEQFILCESDVSSLMNSPASSLHNNNGTNTLLSFFLSFSSPAACNRIGDRKGQEQREESVTTYRTK